MKKRSSKEILAEALLELSQHSPVDKITVKQIVETSGLSLQTFYNHFNDKFDLVLWIHKSEGERTIALLDQDQYGFDELLLDNIHFYWEHREFMRKALISSSGTIPYSEMSAETGFQLWSEYIRKKFDLEDLPEEIKFDLKMYCHSLVRMMAEWAFVMNGVSPELVAVYLRDAMPEKLKPYLLGTS